MKKALILTIVLTVAVAFVGTSMAIFPGQTVEFEGGKMGKVVFDGKTHQDAGNKCNDCHPAIFGPPTKGKERVKIIFKDHTAGNFCFSCHNGEKAFKAIGKCNNCHKKEKKAVPAH